MSASPFLEVVVLVAFLLCGLPLALWQLAALLRWGIFAGTPETAQPNPASKSPRRDLDEAPGSAGATQ